MGKAPKKKRLPLDVDSKILNNQLPCSWWVQGSHESPGHQSSQLAGDLSTHSRLWSEHCSNVFHSLRIGPGQARTWPPARWAQSQSKGCLSHPHCRHSICCPCYQWQPWRPSSQTWLWQFYNRTDLKHTKLWDSNPLTLLYLCMRFPVSWMMYNQAVKWIKMNKNEQNEHIWNSYYNIRF